MMLTDYNGWNLPFATYANVTTTTGIIGLTQMTLAVDLSAWFSVLFVDVDVPQDTYINYAFDGINDSPLWGTWANATIKLVGWTYDDEHPINGVEITHTFVIECFYAANKKPYDGLQGTLGMLPLTNTDFAK